MSALSRCKACKHRKGSRVIAPTEKRTLHKATQTLTEANLRIIELEKKSIERRDALKWMHDALWDAQSKRESETLEHWLNKRAGDRSRYTGLEVALDKALSEE